MGSPRIAKSLPLQVAAVCYRKRGETVEFLLVNTNGGNKWTFPKGSPEARLSHSQAAEREAAEEGGALGTIEPRHIRSMTVLSDNSGGHSTASLRSGAIILRL